MEAITQQLHHVLNSAQIHSIHVFSSCHLVWWIVLAVTLNAKIDSICSSFLLHSYSFLWRFIRGKNQNKGSWVEKWKQKLKRERKDITIYSNICKRNGEFCISTALLPAGIFFLSCSATLEIKVGWMNSFFRSSLMKHLYIKSANVAKLKFKKDSYYSSGYLLQDWH